MLKVSPEHRPVLLLSAIVITVFLALPRLVILLFLKARNYPGAASISWWDFSGKCLFLFVTASLFLWVNIARWRILTPIGLLDTRRFPARLMVTVVLFFIVRALSLRFDLYGGVAVSASIARFLFHLSLVLEVSLCILAAEMYRLLAKNTEAKVQQERLEKINVETKFEVLKNQVNPHFLFNSLNTISAMIDREPVAAKGFVVHMAEVYRHVLNNSGCPAVTLCEELALARAYGQLLLQRHGSSLQLQIEADPVYLPTLLPPMAIQLLLENAIKHNIVSSRLPLIIRITTEAGHVVVSNNVQVKRMKEPSTGVGLHNLNQRYQYLCQRSIGISQVDGLFRVQLPLFQRQPGDPRFIPLHSLSTNI